MFSRVVAEQDWAAQWRVSRMDHNSQQQNTFEYLDTTGSAKSIYRRKNMARFRNELPQLLAVPPEEIMCKICTTPTQASGRDQHVASTKPVAARQQEKNHGQLNSG